MRFAGRKSILLSFSIATAMAWPSASFGWGQDGHEIIATTARDLLGARNPVIARHVDSILDMAHDRLLTQYTDRNGRLHSCHGRTMREVASWPDCVRTFPGHGSTAGYHFDDVPLCDSVAPPPPPVPAYCLNDNCGSAQLPKFVRQLRNTHSTPRQRAEALAWIIHIVGDLHQPLHTETYGDRGGNQVAITIAPGANPGMRGPANNLHSFWDKDLVFAAMHMTDGQTVQSIAALAQSTLTDRDPHLWVVEAHAIAQQAYDQLPAPAYCPVPGGAHMGPSSGGQITAAYVTSFRGAVRDQLAHAAVRLANVLQSALG